MTLRDVLSLIKGGLNEVNADSRKSNKFFYNKLITRTMLIVQRESDALRLAWTQEFYQPLNIIFEEAPAIDPCFGIKSKTVVYRSKSKLPDIYSDSNGYIIGSIETIDGSKRVIPTTSEQLRRNLEDASTSKYDKTLYAVLDNNYLYVLKNYPVVLSAAFIKDIEYLNNCKCDDDPCIRFLDTPWRVPKKIIDATINSIISDMAGITKKIPEDMNINKNPLT